MKQFGVLLIILFIPFSNNRAYADSLNGDWSVIVENFDKPLIGTVPGGIYTDLSNAKLIPDNLKEANDVNNRWVGNRSVTYSTQIEVDETINNSSKVLLIFHGLDTFATIFLNDDEIGKSTNMFLRYILDVKDYLKVGSNQLNVTFESAVKVAEILYEKQAKNYVVPPKCVPKEYNGQCHVNHIRKMQASFGWDWGPAFPSVGIWKSVELIYVNDIKIIESAVDVKDKYENWEVVASMTFVVGENHRRSSVSGRESVKLSLQIEGAGNLETSKIILPNATDGAFFKDAIVLSVPKAAVKKWWPNGYGSQNLYNLKISVATSNGLSENIKRIGFRKVVLVQEPLEKGLTFYFRVNDVPIFAKGSNFIPSSIFPELSSQDKVVRHLLQSSKDAHMNMLRVWGGGLYESDLFYDLADEYGIMIWQDFMFACSMYPVTREFLDSVREEVSQITNRLKHHPSIVLWAGNNENEAALYGNWYGTGKDPVYKQDYIKLYAEVVKQQVESIDATRPFVVSSPSDGLWTDDNGFIGPNPYSNLYGDVHYYNYLSNGWNINQYPITRFASEYGFQSIPSIETLRTATDNINDFEIDSEFLNHRQHLPHGWSFMKLLVSKNFLIPKTNDSFRDFADYIYLSQVNQAVSVRIQTESYRQTRSSLNEIGEGYTMGALYWQLNDVWQAPSWSSIEFGGRWKMLHYYAVQFFAPVIVTARLSESNDLSIYIVSDKPTPISDCLLRVRVYNWNSSQPVHTKKFPNITIGENAAHVIDTLWLNDLLKAGSCGDDSVAKKNCFVELILENADQELVAPTNYIYPAPLKEVILPTPIITIRVNATPIAGKLSNYVDYELEVEATEIALFLWLEVPHALGRFSENGFHIIGRKKSLVFHATAAIVVGELTNNLTVTELSQLFQPDRTASIEILVNDCDSC